MQGAELHLSGRGSPRAVPAPVERGADLLRAALCAPSRLRIVAALRGGPRSVAALAEAAGLSSQATSQHLRVLRVSGLVTGDRRGRAVRYALSAGRDGRRLRAVLTQFERAASGRSGRAPAGTDV